MFDVPNLYVKSYNNTESNTNQYQLKNKSEIKKKYQKHNKV